MNADAGPDVNASPNPEKNSRLDADETAELERELTDDELALIAGGVAGSNETHTKQPTASELGSARP
jgi:hypothetical protein